ncbi:MAG: hypothetical protein Q7S08_01105 [bacterium]|nr:hypothetical protein [bacterium]
MNKNGAFLSIKSRRMLSLAILASLFGLFSPPLVTYATEPVSLIINQVGGETITQAFTPVADVVNKVCTGSNPGAPCYTPTGVIGICVYVGTCKAQSFLDLYGKQATVGLGIVTTILGLAKSLFPTSPTTGNTLNPYTTTNPYGCTGTRYISPTPTNDPCGVYIPITTTKDPNINLNPIGGGTTTVGPVTASLTVVPTSGAAPLAVTFTVTDTSTSCMHGAVSISAGDGTPSATAIPATTSCTGRTPQILTYTYKTPGTYNATITDVSTQKILQSVSVTVGGTTSGVTSASLSVVPTSGAAPLKVTFTVTDTTTSCTHSAVMLSAGDGTNPVVALPAMAVCGALTPANFTYTYGTAGTYTATITNKDTQQILQSVIVTVGGTPVDTTNATLTVTPTSGTAPLAVTFTVTDISTSCPRSAIVLSAGDGSAPVTALPATVTCIGITPAILNYTYRNAGTFTVAIGNANTQKVTQTATVTVLPGSAPATTPLSVVYGTPTSGTVNVSSSLLNLTNPTVKRTVQSGTWGDIQASASGVIITAGWHDTDGRTGVGGFYGYDAVPGVLPQALAGQLCASRPWGSSSATSIIPPSFFDSICTARGYKTTATAPATPAATPKTTTSASSAKTPAKTATTTPAAPVVPAKVYITAVPASVRIGSRTSIFWNAVGVKSCLITSPDGSFNGNTLYGAASTVALTGETVFSIVCIKPDDSQVTNFVKVKMAI